MFSLTKRNKIDFLYQLGLCVSYMRTLEITQNIYENLRLTYELHKMFFPKYSHERPLYSHDEGHKLANFDISASSNFVHSHYHGTSQSVVQFKTNGSTGTPFNYLDVSKMLQRNLRHLRPCLRNTLPSPKISSFGWTS